MGRLRIGVLGAAAIAPDALLTPAREIREVVVTAVAARDRDRAEAFATEHEIPNVHDSYATMVADPHIDAIYNALPNSLHAHWTLEAIRNGKHVLCEKPLTANATQAQRAATTAQSAATVVMEAMHYRYHPLAQRMQDLVRDQSELAGEHRSIRHIQCTLSFPLDSPDDIRYSYSLGGGATMDAGCYALDCIRLLGPGRPAIVASLARESHDDVDYSMSAALRFPGGESAWFDVSLTQGGTYQADVHVVWDHAQLLVQNFLHPHLGYRLITQGPRETDAVTSPASDPSETTYLYQLRAFAAAVLHSQPYPTTPQHALINMRLIDDVYKTAGFPLRGEENGR
jgi:predicted dehydrogenase